MSLPPSFGGQCPSCHKHFANDSCVLRHMNHPRTSCVSSFEFFESTPNPNGQTSTTRDELDRNDETPHDNGATDGPSTKYYELHPNTPLIFGTGPGFIDNFNADRHAAKRRENLYYPFSSKAEWGLASWLLCSGLSMRAIDDFLALPIVSPFLFVQSDLS